MSKALEGVVEILIVEDNEADRRAFKEAIAAACSREVTLHMEDTGEKALSLLNQNKKIDLIILDLNLPAMSGHEVLKHLKAHPRHRVIPVIVFSSSNSPRDIQEAYELQASCYISKPFRFSELVTTVKSVCEFWVNEVKYPVTA